MSLLAAHDVTITLGGALVLDGVTAALEPGERVGLVGPNGAGKTTLLRILAGLLESERGDVARQRGLTLGWLEQRPEPPEGTSALGWVLDAFGDVHALERELEQLHLKMEKAAEPAELERLVEREAKVRERFEAAGGYDVERRAEAALTALGVDPARFHDDPRAFSGGERSRVALARALVREPQVLLLDEPTNHLDLGALEWLEERLTQGREALLVVSHDRYMLDSVCTKIWELRRGKLHAWEGNYSEFREKREAEDERLRHERAKFDRFVEKEQDFIRKNIAGQKTRQAKGRQKILKRRLASDDAPGVVQADGRDPVLRFEETARGGEIALAVDGLEAGYEGLPPLVRQCTFEVRRGERLGVLGPNGCGKTTLLRAITGELPVARGKVRIGANVKVGYSRQEGEDLPATESAISAAHDARPTATLEEMRDLLGLLGLSGEKQETLCGNLSGGERARVSLARVILARPNLLVLDEPTNHLDIGARHALESALMDFEGAIVTVSHDRYFLDEIATKVLAFEAPAEAPRAFPGAYTDYRERVRREERQSRAAAEEVKAREREKERERARRDQEKAQKQQAPRRKKRTLDEVEKAIIASETRRTELHAAMADEATYKDPAKARSVQDELAKVEADLVELNTEWEAYASDG